MQRPKRESKRGFSVLLAMAVEHGRRVTPLSPWWCWEPQGHLLWTEGAARPLTLGGPSGHHPPVLSALPWHHSKPAPPQPPKILRGPANDISLICS